MPARDKVGQGGAYQQLLLDAFAAINHLTSAPRIRFSPFHLSRSRFPLIHRPMLARFQTTTARAVTSGALRPLCAVVGRPGCAATARAFHKATAEFTKLGPEGTLVTNKVSIRVGDPGEAYVCIPTEVGYALQAGSCLAHNSSALPKRPDRLALSYFHDTQHFALGNYYTVVCLVVAADVLIVRLITWLPPPSRSSTTSPPVYCEYKPGNLISLRCNAYNRSGRNSRWYLTLDHTLLIHAC